MPLTIPEIKSAYKKLYKFGSRITQYERSSHSIFRHCLRQRFTTTPTSTSTSTSRTPSATTTRSTSSKRIKTEEIVTRQKLANTVDFFERAASYRGMEWQIITNLLHTEYDRLRHFNVKLASKGALTQRVREKLDQNLNRGKNSDIDWGKGGGKLIEHYRLIYSYDILDELRAELNKSLETCI